MEQAVFFTGRTLKLAHLEEDCPLATFAENKRFSFFFFATGPIKFRYSTMEPLDTIKPFELTWPLRKQPSNLWMLLVRLQKKLENLLWCNNTIFSQVSPVECLYCTINLYHSSISFLLLTFYCRPSMYQNSTLQLYLHYLRQRKIAHNLCTKIHKMSHLDSSSVKSSFSASITVACNENTLLNI